MRYGMVWQGSAQVAQNHGRIAWQIFVVWLVSCHQDGFEYMLISICFLWFFLAGYLMKPPVIFILAVALIAILATRQYIKQRQENAANDASPVRSLLAEVTNKHEFLAPDRHSRQRDEIVAENVRYKVWFRPKGEDDDRVFSVSEQDYQRIRLGDRGELKVQGTRFISFTVQESGK